MVRKPNTRSRKAGRPASSITAGRQSTPRARRYDARRDGILRAAAPIFRDRGFADTGMRDIAIAADLSPANLYHYFKGKDEILFYCQDRALGRMIDGIAVTRRSGTGAAQQLRAVLVTHLLTLLDAVEGATAHLQVESLALPLRSRIVRKRDSYERALRRLVASGMREGVFVRGDAALVTRAMLGALNWTVSWYRADGRSSAREIADQMADYLVRGLVD